MEENLRANSSLILENRKKFNISGLKNVNSFDEETVMLDTVLGVLVVKGIGLHILSFNVETGDLLGEGKVNAFIYTAEEKNNGFFTRLFK